MPQHRYTTDVLVIGSGISGLSAALKVAATADVLLVTKKRVRDCSSYWAQGGISCVMESDDSFANHVEDTLRAGAGLCQSEVVQQVVASGPERIRELIELGVSFTRRRDLGDGDGPDGDAYDLGREGGHTRRRVLHSGDVTGNAIINALHQACADNPRITILEEHQAVDLIASRRLDWDGPNRCLGAYVLDRNTYDTHTVLARAVVLASGGAGKVYLYTSNPDVACGEGIAMAYRAYAEVANMEFYQFHPTCLYHPKAKSFLVSEAVRGEGAELKVRNRHGQLEAFMDRYHELGSLAPRDIVARAIDRELKRSGHPCVYLDITHHNRDYLQKRFPNIYATCAKHDIHMERDPIPVVPAAHYCCGGVRADVAGQTSVTGLFAIGEVACTGLHGANRLASNSLLEGLVMAHECAAKLTADLPDFDARHLQSDGNRPVPDWNPGSAVDPDELIVVYHNWDEIRRFMWDYVGIFRTNKRLQRAKTRVRNIRKEIEHFYWDFTITPELVELRNMASVAEMIIDCALARRESIGLHFNADCPAGDPETAPKETILRRPGFAKTLY